MNYVGFFEKTVAIVDKYGSWKIFQGIVYLGLFIFIIFYIPVITKVSVERATMESIEANDKQKEEAHQRNIENRKTIQPQIYTTLSSIMDVTKADRVFIVELHNGSNNLNGVPFLHGSVTYEKSKEGLDAIDEEFQNLTLSRYDMASYLHKNYSFVGSINEMNAIDKKLASKLSLSGVKYIAITTLHNGTNEWGWFGVLYNREDNVLSKVEIMNELIISSQSITKILNVLKD